MKASRRLGGLWLALVLACVPLVGTPAADRGIGGTGNPANVSPSGPGPSGPGISDRGIGGTGIVGVITGFGSVFVDGLEVAYSPGTPVTVDGVSDPDSAPRVGQVAAIVASEDNGLHAISIDLRHEVSGPVTSVTPSGVTPFGASPNGVTPNGETLLVAGQTVVINSATEGLRTVRPGDWVAVSGLREPDGAIAASRVDPRMPGTVLVRGTATPGQVPAPGGWRIGELAVQPPNGAGVAPGVAPGANITVRGTMVAGGLADTTVDPDVLSADPAAFFGPHVRRMVIESYVSGADGHVRLGHGWLATRGSGVVVPAGAHRAIVQLERGAHGDFVATHLRGAERPVGPGRGERHGALEPPRAAPHPFGPGRYEHPWRDRRPEFGRAGFMPRRLGCGGEGCRRGRPPR